MARLENWNPPKLTQKTATYTWDVDYAAITHEGGMSEDGGYIFPRPWTDRAIAETNLEREFKAGWDETGSLDEAFIGLANTMFGEFHIAMADSVWNWPYSTERKSGESVPAGPRNIIDLGDLYRSQALVFGTEEAS